MSKRNEAFNRVMGELKGRIASHSSERLRRKAQDPVHGGEHEEPDGDEDAQGREPAGPEEKRYGHGLKAIDLPEDTGPMELEEDENAKYPLKSKSPANGNCHNCGYVINDDHKYCPGCGSSNKG